MVSGTVNPGKKTCSRGRSCGNSCVDPSKRCRRPLEQSSSVGKLKSLIESGSPQEGLEKPAKTKGNSPSLTDEQKLAIRDYTQDYADPSAKRPYTKLNNCLRRPPECGEEDKEWTGKMAEEMDGALKALPANKSGKPHYRGLEIYDDAGYELLDRLENAKPGDVISDPSFSSYSSSERVANRFKDSGGSDDTILFISTNKELRSISEHSALSGEQESLLPRGLEQTIKSVRREGGTLIVELE